MADSHNLLNKVSKFNVSPEQPTYSKVVIHTGNIIDVKDADGNTHQEEVVYEKGTGVTGTVLNINNPWGTQEMADAIYDNIHGWSYQPYTATGAHLDPVAELGDGITIEDTYSGIFSKTISFSKLMLAKIEAPTSNEVEHEFNVETVTDRTYSRFVKSMKAEFNIQSTRIEARVTKTSGDETSAFGWELTDDKWRLFNELKDILVADANGLLVYGKIQATSGFIGQDSDNGFTISSSAIYNGITSMDDDTEDDDTANTDGIYLGKDGIKLGKNFKVTNSGFLTALSGEFGSLKINENNKTVGSYGGSLSNCTGSISNVTGSISNVTGSVSGVTGSVSTEIKVGDENIDTRIKRLAADQITAGRIDAVLGNVQTFQLNGHTVKEHLMHDGDGNLVLVLATQW